MNKLSNYYYASGADGRSLSLACSVYGNVITKFSRTSRLPHFLSYGAPPARGAPLSILFQFPTLLRQELGK